MSGDTINAATKVNLSQGSMIRRMFEAGIALRAQYGDDAVCDFSLGNPDLAPPPQAASAMPAAHPQDSAEGDSEHKGKDSPDDAEIPDIPYDLMTVEQLQAVILSKMAKNGPVTDRMRRDVTENIWHNSLVNWANSF